MQIILRININKISRTEVNLLLSLTVSVPWTITSFLVGLVWFVSFVRSLLSGWTPLIGGICLSSPLTGTCIAKHAELGTDKGKSERWATSKTDNKHPTTKNRQRQPPTSANQQSAFDNLQLTKNNKQVLPTVITGNRNHDPTINSQQPIAGKYSKIKKPGWSNSPLLLHSQPTILLWTAVVKLDDRRNAITFLSSKDKTLSCTNNVDW